MAAELIDDKVWWNRERKLAGICHELEAATAGGRNALVLAHFDETLRGLELELAARRMAFSRFVSSDSAAVCGRHGKSPGQLWAGRAQAFQPSNTLASIEPSKALPEVPLEIIVAEHYPLRSRDELLLTAAGKLGCQSQLTFHISLDDPLLVHFGVNSVQHLFQQLGMDEEASLSNSLITSAIRRAQEKIESGTPKDLPAHSIADWFKYNHAAK
jgi:hypothetical protein